MTNERGGEILTYWRRESHPAVNTALTVAVAVAHEGLAACVAEVGKYGADPSSVIPERRSDARGSGNPFLRWTAVAGGFVKFGFCLNDHVS